MALRYGFGRGGVVNKGALTGKRWDGGEVVWGKRVMGNRKSVDIKLKFCSGKSN